MGASAPGRPAIAVALSLALSACGGLTTAPGAADGAAAIGAAQGTESDDGATTAASAGDAISGTATCSGDASMCNRIVDVGSPVVPTCASGAIPTGTGGAIADGAYVLTAQTFYGIANNCPASKTSTTLVIAGGCFQAVAHESEGSAGSVEVRTSSTGGAQGNRLTLHLTCTGVSDTQAGPTTTFTARASTLTLLTADVTAGNGNPYGVAEVFTKR